MGGDEICELERVTRKLVPFPALFEVYFRSSLDLCVVASTDGFFRVLNDSWTRELGWELAEIKAVPYLNLIHPEDVQKTIEASQKMERGENLTGFENRFRCKNGTYKTLIWSAPFFQDGLSYCAARVKV